MRHNRPCTEKKCRISRYNLGIRIRTDISYFCLRLRNYAVIYKFFKLHSCGHTCGISTLIYCSHKCMIIFQIRFFIGIGTCCHAKLHLGVFLCQFFCSHTVIITCRKNHITTITDQHLKIVPLGSLGNIIHRNNFNFTIIFLFYIRQCLYKIICIHCTCISDVDNSYFYGFIFITP